MKSLLVLFMSVFALVLIPSCNLIKKSMSTTTEIYFGQLKGQPVKFIDKNGYIDHLISMRKYGFYAEHIKGVNFSPINNFNWELQVEPEQLFEPQLIKTSDGSEIYWIPLLDRSGQLLIKPYSRIIR